jgi:hypothetical protein
MMFEVAAMTVSAKSILEKGKAIFLLVVSKVYCFIEQFLSSVSKSALVSIDTKASGFETLA